MRVTAIRQKLTDYMKVADDKKIKAMYALLEDEINRGGIEYSDGFKAELNRRYEYYQSGGKMVNAIQAGNEIKKVLQKAKRK